MSEMYHEKMTRTGRVAITADEIWVLKCKNILNVFISIKNLYIYKDFHRSIADDIVECCFLC